MTWLYVPGLSASSHCVLGEEDSTWGLNSRCQLLAQSCTWRGNLSPARIWSARLKKVTWLQRLFGVMPEPSTADHGADLWMASLAVSRASLIALPENGLEKQTNATYGPTQGASSSSQVRGSSSSRMSAGCCLRAVRNECGETFTAWASRLREDCSRRQKSAQAMNENDFSSSLWRTPTDDSAIGGPQSPEKRLGGGHTLNLQDQVMGFQVSARPTPTANDWKGSGPTLKRKDGQMRGDRLDYATEQIWSAPRASDAEKGGPNQSFGAGGVPLPAQSVQWSTPSVADVQGGRKSRSGDRNSELLMNGQADDLCSLLAPTTSTDGEVHSKQRRSLNPLFVEWLMGWPPGWTLLSAGPELTAFACSETALCVWRQRMRSALLQLGLPREAPPAQLALFG